MRLHNSVTADTQPTVHVLATSVDGTRAALATAIPLARGSRGRLVVLVPQIVPYPLAVDGPTDATAFTERRYRDLVEEVDGDAEVRVCLCRALRDVVQAIPPASTVVVGGRSGGVMASREERLARRLTRLGYHTVFAAVTVGSVAFHAAIIAAMLSLLGARSARAQQGDRPSQAPGPAEVSRRDWQYGGFVDISYLRDFNDPSNHLFRSRGTAFHVNEWDVNMAGAYVKKKTSEQSRWGTEVLVQGGKDEEVFGFSATAPNLAAADWIGHLGLANVSYLAPIGTGLAVQAGIFGSLIGYDSLYAKDNLNYTRPWGADFTPYLMTGVNASYAVTDKATATVFVVNGYWHLADANHVPSSGGQLAYKAGPRATVKETVLWGPHQANTSLPLWRFLSDSIVEHRGDRVIAAFEYQLSTEGVDASGSPRAWWMSAQLPVHWTLHGPWSVSVRPEIAWDSAGRWTGYEQSIKAVTTTLEYRRPDRWAHTIFRVEHRVDDSRGAAGGFFHDGEVNPGVIGLTPTQHLLIFGVIFTFDSPSER
jgi:hypothetical protein